MNCVAWLNATRSALSKIAARSTSAFKTSKELARQRGLTSDPDLVLGEPPTPKSSSHAARRSSEERPSQRSKDASQNAAAQFRIAPAQARCFRFPVRFGRQRDFFSAKSSMRAWNPTGSKRIPQEAAASPRQCRPEKQHGAQRRNSGEERRPWRSRSGATPRTGEGGSDSDVKLVADGSDLGFSVE
ncbi:MAG: hypothetical protein U0744_05710 [Gemmataceae bacterium]